MSAANLPIPHLSTENSTSLVVGGPRKIIDNDIVQWPSKRFIRGRGERKIFQQAIIWMSHNHLKELETILPYIPDCGYWKDLLVLMETPAENEVIKIFGTQLIKDYESFNQSVPGLISLAAKWTPNEKSTSDKKHGTNGKIAKFMGISRKILRTKYLVPLRKYLIVTEQLITDKKWNIINYNLVPKISLKFHSKSFHKHDGVRFTEHLNKSHIDHIKQFVLPDSHVNFEGINSDTNAPVNVLSNNSDISDGFTIENSSNIIFAIDVSGAMSGFPKTLAACLCCDSNSQYWIPFRFDNNRVNQNASESLTSTEIVAVPIFDNTLNNRIKSIIDSTESGHDMETCIRIAYNMGKSHIIFISNILLDDSELPREDLLFSRYSTGLVHFTFWSLTMDHPTIMDKKYMTIIEGYDINIYTELQQGHILSRAIYKDIIVNILQEENIMPII